MTTEQDLVSMKQKGVLTDEEFLKALSQLRAEERKASFWSDPEKAKKRIIFSIVLLGIFSIITGLGLIVAANWGAIPAIIKVGAGLVCLAISLLGTSYFQKRQKPLWSEALLFISFLLVGANVVLIDRSYHFDFSWQKTSMVWWVFSFPLIFFTKFKLIPLCSVGLLVFSLWDVIWDVNYMLIAGLMFVLMMLTHFSNGSLAKLFRDIAFFAGIFCLYVGDVIANSGAGMVGVVTTTLFLILAFNTPKTEDGAVKYYNYLFLLVAWRIFLLFWNAYYNLTSIGVLLIVFGSILLTGAGLYTYYFKQIQECIRSFIKHENP